MARVPFLFWHYYQLLEHFFLVESNLVSGNTQTEKSIVLYSCFVFTSIATNKKTSTTAVMRLYLINSFTKQQHFLLEKKGILCFY